jgi:hypothetical protein
MPLSRHSIQDKIINIPFENATKLKNKQQFEIKIIFPELMKSKLNSGNACYYSESFVFPPRNVNITT